MKKTVTEKQIDILEQNKKIQEKNFDVECYETTINEIIRETQVAMALSHENAEIIQQCVEIVDELI